jgi:hypothetical protein
MARTSPLAHTPDSLRPNSPVHFRHASAQDRWAKSSRCNRPAYFSKPPVYLRMKCYACIPARGTCNISGPEHVSVDPHHLQPLIERCHVTNVRIRIDVVVTTTKKPAFFAAFMPSSASAKSPARMS